MESISKRESQVISHIKEKEKIIFTPKDVERFLDISKQNAHRVLNNMREKDLVKRIERGKYTLKDSWKELDIYEIVPYIFKPSYIAFWSALHYHNMTDQVPRTVFLITTKRKKSLKLQGQKIRYVTIKKDLFFGYERFDKVVVSDKEKTIIDSLRHPEYSGGISHIYESVQNNIDTEKLIDYCKRTNNSTIASRLGYILDKKEIEFDREELKDMIDNYSKLDPKKDKIDLDSEWKLYVNRRIG